MKQLPFYLTECFDCFGIATDHVSSSFAHKNRRGVVGGVERFAPGVPTNWLLLIYYLSNVLPTKAHAGTQITFNEIDTSGICLFELEHHIDVNRNQSSSDAI